MINTWLDYLSNVKVLLALVACSSALPSSGSWLRQKRSYGLAAPVPVAAAPVAPAYAPAPG